MTSKLNLTGMRGYRTSPGLAFGNISKSEGIREQGREVRCAAIVPADPDVAAHQCYHRATRHVDGVAYCPTHLRALKEESHDEG